jgi:acetyl esterase/lipase
LREYEGKERIRVTTFIGTNDILYPQNVRMQARLEALGVKSDLHVVSCALAFRPNRLLMCLQYDGLFHVFPLLPWLPESMDAFEKIRALF